MDPQPQHHHRCHSTCSQQVHQGPLHSLCTVLLGVTALLFVYAPSAASAGISIFPLSSFLLLPPSSFLLHPTPTHSHAPTTTHTLVRPIHPTPSHLPTALSHAHFIFSPPLDGALMASDAVGALTADRASRRVSSALPMRPLHSNSPVLSCTSSPSAIYLTGLLPAALKRTHC